MGKNLLKTTILALFWLLLAVKPASAEYTAGSSAAIKKDKAVANKSIDKTTDYYLKKVVIRNVLISYNSSLENEVDSFINACQKYNLDCYLLPSITGVESFFGKYLVYNSYNPFGWGGGYIMFKNWDQAIDTVAAGIRNNYINRGADTVEKIGPIYATTFTWAPKVNHFIAQFKKEEEKFLLFFNNNKVEL